MTDKEKQTISVETPEYWIKRFLPKTLFGRALLIIVTPLILMQAISTFVFFDRHWDTMTRRLSHTLAGDISLVVDRMTPLPTDKEINAIAERIQTLLHMIVTYESGRMLPNISKIPPHDRVESTLAEAMKERVRRPFNINSKRQDRRVVVEVQLADGLLVINVHQKRLYSSTPYIFLMWMIGSSLVLFAIAILFMRNQIRPIRRLATAARSFGMGREIGDFRPEGATEVRQAAEAFRQMRQRIRLQFTQRTEMLAGVSHDLRTPLTRMKLQLAMLENISEISELQQDVHDMEQMVEGYLAFARGEGTETPIKSDLVNLVSSVVIAEQRDGSYVRFKLIETHRCTLEVRPQALERALSNLITNAKRYAETIDVELRFKREIVTITVDDDGPGIPEKHQEDVFKPFFRLDPSRNPNTGGTGLGLTIARDIARSHGGNLILEKAPTRGLRAQIILPI